MPVRFGWRAPLRFANLNNGSNSGAFNVNVNNAPTNADANIGAFYYLLMMLMLDKPCLKCKIML